MAVSLIGEQFATVIQAAGLVGPNFADTASALEPRPPRQNTASKTRWHGSLSANINKNANLGYSHDRG